MKGFLNFGGFAFLAFMALTAASTVFAQNAKETYTGTVLSYGTGLNTRSTTRTFTLNITGTTSDTEAKGFLATLRDKGQSTLLDEINDEKLGNFSVGGRIGPTINVVRESDVDGQRRIFVVFERWMQFAELRGGYRSTDYPFGVIELFMDERTGKGTGTYIEAAKIRWNYDDKSKQYQVEIENFATFPAKLLGVTQSGGRGR
ncbi:MAG TPA: hypothetical protein VGC76_09185 [Pyrinomonadaceae bacterium]